MRVEKDPLPSRINSASDSPKGKSGTVFFGQIKSIKSSGEYLVTTSRGQFELKTGIPLQLHQRVSIKIGRDGAAVLLKAEHLPVQDNNTGLDISTIQRLFQKAGLPVTAARLEQVLLQARNEGLDPARLRLELGKRLKSGSAKTLKDLLDSGETESQDVDPVELSMRSLYEFFHRKNDLTSDLGEFNRTVSDPSDHWVLVPFCLVSGKTETTGLFKLNFDLDKKLLKQAVIQPDSGLALYFHLKLQNNELKHCFLYPGDERIHRKFSRSGFEEFFTTRFPSITFRLEPVNPAFDGWDGELLKTVDERV